MHGHYIRNVIKTRFLPRIWELFSHSYLIMGSRHTRRSGGDRERTSNSQREGANSALSEDTESDNESDLVSVLAFLLRR